MSEDLTEFDLPEQSNNWELTTAKPHRLIWTSPSDYAIKVELPKASVTGILPPTQIEADSGQPSLQEQGELHPGTGDAQEAINIAVSWLDENPIEIEDTVRDLPGIGDRVADYLALRHDVVTLRTVKREYKHGKLKSIVQDRFHDDLENQIL